MSDWPGHTQPVEFCTQRGEGGEGDEGDKNLSGQTAILSSNQDSYSNQVGILRLGPIIFGSPGGL